MAVNEELLKKVLEEIRPNLRADGGDMEYVGVDDEASSSWNCRRLRRLPHELADPVYGH